MKTTLKFAAAISAIFLLAACETNPNAAGGTNANGETVDGQGRVVGTLPGDPNNTPDRVFFDYDSAVIKADAESTLQGQANYLKTNSGVNIVIEGHCDERGTREYNLALGERRASSTKNYLVGLGVDASRISTISYGKERPAVVGSDDAAWAQNRRSVTVVTNQ